MFHDEPDSVSAARASRPMHGIFRGPTHGWPPTYIDSPPDEFPSEDRDDASLQLWFLDEDDETGRIGDGLEIEYDGEFGSDIETTIDDVAAETEDGPGPDSVDFNRLSVQLYADVGLQQLVHVSP